MKVLEGEKLAEFMEEGFMEEEELVYFSPYSDPPAGEVVAAVLGECFGVLIIENAENYWCLQCLIEDDGCWASAEERFVLDVSWADDISNVALWAKDWCLAAKDRNEAKEKQL